MSEREFGWLAIESPGDAARRAGFLAHALTEKRAATLAGVFGAEKVAGLKPSRPALQVVGD
jgi:hypothetical protein